MYLEDRGEVLGLFDLGEMVTPSIPIPVEISVIGIEGAAATVGVGVAVVSGRD